jgi:hypothetical protein
MLLEDPSVWLEAATPKDPERSPGYFRARRDVSIVNFESDVITQDWNSGA